MCFYDGGDWCAMVWKETKGPAKNPARCLECGAKIQPGEWRIHNYQQEYEECQRCEYEELEEGEEPCDPHDYGEVFTCDICASCDKVLQAIEAVETDEGCPTYARRPLLGDLQESFYNGDGEKYRDRALKMFPELASCKWLADASSERG